MEPVSQNRTINCYHCDRVWIGRQRDIPVPQPEIHHYLAFSSIFPDLFSSFPFLSGHFLPLLLKKKKKKINRSTLFLCVSTYTELAFSLMAVGELKVDRICLGRLYRPLIQPGTFTTFFCRTSFPK